MNSKIVVSEPMDFSESQLQRLRGIASAHALLLQMSANNPSREDWLRLASESRILICGKQGMSARDASGAPGSEGIYSLPKGIIVSHPFVNVAWVDRERLRAGGITLLFAPGSNRDAVGEWAAAAMLHLSRRFDLALNKEQAEPKLARSRGLKGKKILIMGRGAVGGRISELAQAFKMHVDFLLLGQNPAERVIGADFVVNCLSSGKENHGILDAPFFNKAMSEGSIFISMTSPLIYSIEGLLEALKSGRLAGAGIDVGNTFPGDVANESYAKFLKFMSSPDGANKNLFVTPQVAHFSDDSQRSSYDMAIDNVEQALNNNLEAVKERVWA